MIVYKKNKGFLTRSDKPNENWTSEKDVYVVKDGSELAKKIELNFPHYEFVENLYGKLTDIVPLPKPPEPKPEPLPPNEMDYLSDYVLDLELKVLMIQMGL